MSKVFHKHRISGSSVNTVHTEDVKAEEVQCVYCQEGKALVACSLWNGMARANI